MRTLKRNLLFSAFVFSLTLLVSEIIFRSYLFGFDSLQFNIGNSIHPIGESGLIKPSAHPEILYELKPNLNRYFKKSKFVTNSKGLRDKELSLAKASDEFRVIVVGDSLTMPSGVNIEDAYHSILEDRFNRESKDIVYEFINFGVGGYELDQYLGVIKHKVMQYDPDLILIGFSGNDFQVSEKSLPYKVLSKTNPYFDVWLIKKLVSRFRRSIRRSNDIPQVTKIFLQIAAVARKQNVPVVVASLSMKPFSHQATTVLRDITEDNGFYYVDTSFFFRRKNTKKYFIYRDDRHPNAEAHKLFADLLYNYFKQTGLL